jgi:predicted outer membrane repeat protein
MVPFEMSVHRMYFINNNSAYRGGAIYRASGTLSLTGNLFSGNTASDRGNVVYGTVSAITSGGYNVSDNVAVTGTTSGSGSGYDGTTGDLFDVTDISFATDGDPTTKPSSASNLKTLTTLPEGFPTVYFDGTSRNTPATAGAVSAD